MAGFQADDERVEELGTLQSIYPELELDLNNAAGPAATLELAVTPVEPLQVVFEPESTIHKLSHLPPLILEIICNQGYPAERAPTFRLTTNPPWLSEETLKQLEDVGRQTWEEYGGMQMLFSYITVLLERAETAFQDKETLPDTVLKLPQSLKDALLDLNERLEKETFEKQTFDCGICLDPKKGTQCYRIRHCGHVFCIKCLQDYYNDAIKEGAVQNITCLDPTCGKTGNPAIDRTLKPRKLTPKELLRIPLDLEMVTRYVEIKRKKLIESDPSIVFCPREWCQGAMRTAKYPKPGDITQMDDPEAYEFDAPAAPREKTEDEIAEENRMFGAPHTDRLAVCEDCNLAFCKVCLRSWHGDLVRCANRNKKQISPEEQASLDFILGATTPCPQCEARCQKSHGCNHMQCFNCDAHFCYICAAWLDPRNPYDHFNFKRNEQCYGKLFQGVEGNDDEIEFAGARAAEIQAAVFDQEAARIQDEVIQEQLDQEEG